MVCRFVPADGVRVLRAPVEIPMARVATWTMGPRVGKQADMMPEADSTTHQVSAVANVPVVRIRVRKASRFVLQEDDVDSKMVQ